MNFEQFVKRYAREIALIVVIGLSLIELALSLQEKRETQK